MTPELSLIFDRVDAKRRRLFSYRPIPTTIIARVKHIQDVAWLHACHVWGGGTMRVREIETVVETGEAIGGHPVSEHVEILNLAEALEWIEEWAKSDLPMRARDILHVHALLHTGLPGACPGRFRTSELRLDGARYAHTPGQEIPRRIQTLCSQINGRAGRRLHPLARAVLAFRTLTAVLPFREGNELVARLILNGLLLQRSYPIATFLDPEDLREAQQAALAGHELPLAGVVAEAVEAGLDRYLAALA